MFPLNRRRAFLVLASIGGLAAAFFWSVLPVTTPNPGLNEGEPASRTVRAPKDISFVSPSLTLRRQNEAASAVPESLVFDPSIAANQQSQLDAMLGRIRAVIEDANNTAVSRGTALERVEKLALTSGSLSLLRNMTPGDFRVIETESRRALAAVFEQSLPASLVADTQSRAATYVGPNVGRDQSTLIGEIIRPFITSNLVVDRVRTDQARLQARSSVAPVQVSFARNQVIVEHDGPITAEAREALLKAGVIDSPWEPHLVGAGAIIAIAIAVVVTAGLHAFRPSTTAGQLVAMGLAVAVPVFVMKVLTPLFLPDDERHFFMFFIPTAVGAMVISGFIGAELALLAASLVAFLTSFVAVLLLDSTVAGLADTLDVARLVLVTGLSGAAGVFAVRNAESLKQFLAGGLFVSLSVVAALGATWLIDSNRGVGDLPWILLAGVANGGLSAFLSAGIFVTIGSFLGITTRLQLLEMSQLSQPLLLRLQDEAPSTFQHSVIVANLAEKGAHTIGADALLARVGCYYHDIGKLARPGFFIENQFGGPNPHDALDAADSARIIADHVTDGLALAQQYKVPTKVAAFIPEHHGTRFVSYFYRQAAEENPDADPEAFRYPGPRPQTRETGIAMLADSTEAAVRSNPDHSPESIDRIVEEVFAERVSEGQLDESDLTLRNIRELAESFKATLRAVYHPRIEYPAPSEAELLLRRLPVKREVTSNR